MRGSGFRSPTTLDATKTSKWAARACAGALATGSGVPAVLDAGALARFEALRAWRLEAARDGAVPPYVVASDRALREIALIQPTRVEDLTLAHGIGEGKAARYGEEILRVLRELDGATG